MQWVWFLLGTLIGASAAGGIAFALTRRLGQRLRRMRRRVRTTEHLVEVAQLTGGLAHEIKNPLSTIKLNLRLLGEQLATGDPERDRQNALRLTRLQDEVQRLHDVLEEFLRFAGKMDLTLQDLDLRQVLEELNDFYRPQADAAGVVLRTDVPARAVTASADGPLLKQAVLNLMINATQAMTEGGEMLLRLGSTGDQAVVEVIDSGPGMDAEACRKVFQAYYTTRSGGTGLGLPLTRRIIRLHGGDIRVDSEPGRGTRFTVSLPLVRPS
ncbi:MAG: sensor histidine kinase [Planctomycetota bacterium]|jgi:signal transduction histidine kinase